MIDEIVKKITEISGTYSGYEIFSDWIKALALSISNSTDIVHGKIWQDREQQYLEIAKKHGADTMKSFVELGGMSETVHWMKYPQCVWKFLKREKTRWDIFHSYAR